MTGRDEWTGTLQLALDHALDHLSGSDARPVGATASLDELRARLGRALTDEGVPPHDVIDELVRDVEGGILNSTGGRFFGWVIGGTLPAALAADWLVSAWDQNAAIHACGPAEAVIEEVAGTWLKQLFGLPNTASFAFVTGTQMAHVTCLGAARHRLLARAGWDVEDSGLFGAPAIRVLTSSERHGSVERALRVLGLGRRSVRSLPCNDDGQLAPSTLAHALADSTQPTIVILQAGDLNIGAFDPFAELIPIARKHDAWVHVDGAFGLWAAASPRYRHLLRGVELADSWTNDGHKWLNTPFDCGYAFVADPKAHRGAFSHRTSYTMFVDGARDQIDWTPEWSRRGRAVPTYAAIRQLGRNGIADLVERCCGHAHALVTRIGRLPGASVVREPTINQGLVRFLDPHPGATDMDHDRRTDAVIAAICASGEAFFGGTTWRGRRCMRVSVCNWQTCEADIDRAVAAAGRVLGRPTM
ncbi:aminotransferase class V-fold PLP-dependent enzyme [Bradyrhizobium ontarionense]|uniref:Aminotransferase class V-fold PLP-dependent enzyme n=1 Tax=Bradyrhizobium ontarionense TaxID=2898149 RepID=A0ABY3RIB3_9BRAD|nr:aminotransferase class V-fold PLP-dependent enzyme [Bradyrhizobium sp. A19]UFZ07063.1 aminotransferase class V-fold PLP-dependent enzyme [Bradyrhizobium sp. A19]